MYRTFLKPLAVDIKNFVLDILFPKNCLACGREGEFICADCLCALRQPENQRCISCQKNAPFGQTHPKCLTPHGADALISFFDYHDGKVANILIKAKYYFLPEVYKILGSLLAEKIQNDPDFSFLLKANSYQLNPVLAPIPLHPSRRRWRGFNQAEVLCQSLGAELNWPAVNALARKKATRTQKDLAREQRLKNVNDAFAINPSQKANFFNRTVILVDDVTTTGATLQEAAKILKRNGASRVICLTVARD